MKNVARRLGIVFSVSLLTCQLCAQGEKQENQADQPAAKPANAPEAAAPAAVAAPAAAAAAPAAVAAPVAAAAAPAADAAAVAAPAAPPVADAAPTAPPAADAAPAAAVVPNATAGEAANAAPIVAPAGDGNREALVSEVVTLERLRKNALREYGMASLVAARKALRSGDFEEAKKQYIMAETYIPDNNDTRVARDEARLGIREALYRNALLVWKKGDREKAIQIARQASEKGHADAPKLVAEIQKEIENPPKAAPVKETSRMLDAAYKGERDDVMRHLRIARQYYVIGEYDRSRQELEIILRDHPYNTEAMEMMEKLGDRTYDISVTEFDAIRSRMIRDVKANWSTRRYAIDTVDIKEPSAGQASSRALLPGGITLEQSVEQKMRAIVIPEINFRNASITDVITFFENTSREYDDPALPPEKRGVNFALRGVAPTAAPSAGPTSTDPFQTAADASAPGGAGNITFTARFVSLWDALKIVTGDVANFKFRIRGNVVIVMPMNVTDESMETRSYTVMPNVIERATGLGREMSAAKGGGTLGGDAISAEALGPQQDLKKLFGDLGVAWPVGSSISYLSIIGKLRVVNTTENLAVFEKVLEEMNVTPRQIEIEARFIEVSQVDLDSLGVEWYQNGKLTRNDGTAGSGRYGGGTLSLNGRDAFASPYNMSQGMRYLDNNLGSALGTTIGGQANDSLFNLQGVFGQLDITTVLHALSQRSNTDLLSAPKVVTKAGQEAVIKVITEYIYPTTFTVIGGQAAAGTAGNAVASQPGVEPGGFQTREVGVILQVVPEVSAEGQMINLTMNPQVVSEPQWKDYGYDVVTPGTDTSDPIITHIPMEQPLFKVRSISTSVSIYNGATVVMGGMITENRIFSDDKIPVLGDLPYIGRLFRSKAEQTDKRNLLIFVTARLVDPAGRTVKTSMEPILSPKAIGGNGGGGAVTEAPKP
ncbi:MAG: hypothetical protein WCR06_05970 [bacterium]